MNIPVIVIWPVDIQALTKKYFGTILSDSEVASIRRIFQVELTRTDDGGWEGAVSQLIQALTSVIGLVIEDHRHTRGGRE